MDRRTDLTSGGILQKLVFVALPIMGTQLMQMMYNLTDMFWLGRLSSDAVAASGAAGMYLWLGMAPLLFGRMGAEIGVSQNKGRGEMKTAESFARNAWQLSLLLGVAYTLVLLLFSGPLLSVFNIREAHVADDSALYLRVIGLGAPAVYMTSALIGAFIGAGNSRIPFYCNAAGQAANIILDPIFIFTFDMGILGAAIASIITQWGVLALILIAVKKHRDRPFADFRLSLRPEAEKIRQIIRWSLPVSIESALFTLLSMPVTRMVTGFGTEALAVQRVGSQIESLSWLIGGGFGSAVTAFMGQNFGAGKWGRIDRGFRISSATMLVWGFLITVTLFFGGYSLYGLFLPEHELRSMGAVYLKILAACQIVACLEAVGAGLFRGTGRTVPPSVASIAGNAVRAPLCYALSLTPLGLNGIWWGVAVTAALRGIFIYGWAFFAFFRGRGQDGLTLE